MSWSSPNNNVFWSLQKALFKGEWSLATGYFKQNYCHACHTRFAVFFPLPSCCVSSLILSFRGKTISGVVKRREISGIWIKIIYNRWLNIPLTCWIVCQYAWPEIHHETAGQTNHRCVPRWKKHSQSGLSLYIYLFHYLLAIQIKYLHKIQRHEAKESKEANFEGL